MSNPAQYRFLPWSRRGLSAHIDQVDTPTPAARAEISVGITVTNATSQPVKVQLHGPGDLLGIDQTLIVRRSPVAGATNVETNYFPAIEFDAPDFPWMFTPARADGAQRLRPWLVLIVVDAALVKEPRAKARAPLPTIQLSAEAAASELPDLAESWAWAHTQLLSERAQQTDIPGELTNNPNLNVSRLIAPRRLEPNRNYLACLVPAFDAGVIKGLGGNPDAKKPLAPAWSAAPGALELPVYHHWAFSTGPLGDFESLARKLVPYTDTASVGYTSIYVGDGNPETAVLPPTANNPMLEGALRGISGEPSKLEDIPQPVRDGLTSSLNAPVERAAGRRPGATLLLGPPIYGQWHVDTHQISNAAPRWLRELNLDPRTRVAAGLGAEVVRKFQEELMQQAWEQVGAVLKANEKLSLARLSLEASRRSFRALEKFSAQGLFMLTSPLHARTLVDGVTLAKGVRGSSLPNAASDPALRRLTSAQRPMLKRAMRKLDGAARLAPAFKARGGSALVSDLASGRRQVDPNQFVPDGLLSSKTLDAVRGANADVDLSVRGLALTVTRSALLSYGAAADTLRGLDVQGSELTIKTRSDLATRGIVTRSMLDGLVELQVAEPGKAAHQLDKQSALNDLLEVSKLNPGALAALATLSQDRVQWDALELDAGGKVSFRDGVNRREIGAIDVSLLADRGAAGQLLAELPPGTFSREAEFKPTLTKDLTGGVLLKDSKLAQDGRFRSLKLEHAQPMGPALSPRATVVSKHPEIAGNAVVATPSAAVKLSKTIATPIKDAKVIKKYEQSLSTMLAALGVNTPVDLGRVVPFDLGAARSALLTRVDPQLSVRRRVLEQVRVDGKSLESAAALGIFATAQIDRVLTAPVLPAPLYQYLADTDEERFVPGIGRVPVNSMLLLETNPRFIEAFMVGFNYELNREYLWRGYPSDRRATSCAHFWDWLDDKPDIPPIHSWRGPTALGSHARGAGAGGQIVLLIRADLVRRYPLMLLACKSDDKGKLVEPLQIKEPVFHGRLGIDTVFAGFDLVQDDLTRDGGWLFMLQEQPTEPRFGFDQQEGPLTPLRSWADVSWEHVGVAPGGYLNLARSQLNARKLAELTFGADSAQLAAITLQRPMRVAVHGRHFLKGNA
jgi:hypothetical protein